MTDDNSLGRQEAPDAPVAAPVVVLKPSEVLERAAALIEPEGAWTKGAWARYASGNSADEVVSGDVVCWCVRGAVANVVGGLWRPAGIDAEEFLARVSLDDIAEWNDAPDRTQAEVVAALRQAAELARAEEATTRTTTG